MEKTNFVFKANTPSSLVGGFVMLLVITGFAIASLFAGKRETIIAGVILFGISYLVFRTFIHRVQFGAEGIELKYFIRKSLKIEHSDVWRIYGLRSRPDFGLLVFVMCYKNAYVSGKITFTCTEEELEPLLNTYFIGQRVDRSEM
jgi:hypothetical protein